MSFNKRLDLNTEHFFFDLAFFDLNTVHSLLPFLSFMLKSFIAFTLNNFLLHFLKLALKLMFARCGQPNICQQCADISLLLCVVSINGQHGVQVFGGVN